MTKAFTLIELIFVIIILGILSTVAFPKPEDATKKAAKTWSKGTTNKNSEQENSTTQWN